MSSQIVLGAPGSVVDNAELPVIVGTVTRHFWATLMGHVELHL